MSDWSPYGDDEGDSRTGGFGCLAGFIFLALFWVLVGWFIHDFFH